MNSIETQALFDLGHTLAAPLLAQVRFPWEALKQIKDFIQALGEGLDPAQYEERAPGVWVARDAKVFDSAYLAGPVIIGHEAEVRQCAFIRGSALVGAGAVVGNSTELKNCILFDKVQVPHFNYVGDSILGYRAHMGAGAVTSNVKSDKKNVVVRLNGQALETGLRKFGAMVGDRVEVGCNSVLNPGTILGRDSMVYPTSCVRGVVPERSIHKNDGRVVPRIMEEN
ncbi:MAG TPA: UDP-N-acetylglucosamine pyrophosphorylase [Candidatus Excrementavichristensenella intestinipullorum]|nr:UDP-N-acetylglucosamine pyrophosphorylase [Candidatus Excrementavichristensenella intestinipullorum]